MSAKSLETRAAFSKHLQSMGFHNETISIFNRMLEGHNDVVLRQEIFEEVSKQYYFWLTKQY